MMLFMWIVGASLTAGILASGSDNDEYLEIGVMFLLCLLAWPFLFGLWLGERR